MASLYCCSACGQPIGCITDVFKCHRTGRIAQPHQPGPALRTPRPSAEVYQRPERGRIATKRQRRRKLAPTTDWLGDVAPVASTPVDNASVGA